MRAARIFNLLNGWFYLLYGAWGVLNPRRIANFMGWTPDILGLHQIRALWFVTLAAGLIIIMNAHKQQDQRPLLLAMIFITLALASGRLLGLALDGAGPVQTYYELGFEVFWAFVGFWIYSHVKKI